MRLFAILLALLLSLDLQAGTVSRLYNFEADTPAEADKVDEELDNIISEINGNLSSANFLDGGIATADIASYSVTKAKMGPLGHQISSSSAFVERSSQLEAAIQNMTTNLTVVSRPVFVGLMAEDGAAAPGQISYRNGAGGGFVATDNAAYITFQRDQATKNMMAINARVVSELVSSHNVTIALPCSAFWFIDTPDPGPHNYTAFFRTATNNNGIIQVENCKLVVFEL